jgi:mono/diheme cytochrome c family protein
MHHLAAPAAHHRTHTARVGSLICRSLICLVALTAAAGLAHAQQTPESVSTRGELLYSTHCIECHTTQMHWRAQRKAVDWDTLKFQVSRWQGVANLGWSNTDIDDVARYLNDTIYKFPRQVSQRGREPGGLAAREPNCARWVAAPAT